MDKILLDSDKKYLYNEILPASLKFTFLVDFYEMYGAVRACPPRTNAWGASRTVPGCLGVVSRRVRMPWVA